MTTTVRRDALPVPSIPSVRLRQGGPLPIGRRVLWPILLLAALVVAAGGRVRGLGRHVDLPDDGGVRETPGLFPGAAVTYSA